MTVVQRESAYQQALDWMRARIASGDWPIGARIPTEPELTALLGVGRNTLREAIKCLTSTGILEIRRGDGTYVCARTDIGGLLTRQVAVSEMLHVYEVRRALELEAVRLACVRRTDDDVRRLREALDLRNETVAPGTAAHSPTPISPSTSRSSPQPTIRSSTNCSPGSRSHCAPRTTSPKASTSPNSGRDITGTSWTGSSRATSRSRRAAHAVISTCSSPGARTPADAERSARSGRISRSAFRSRKVFSAWQSIVSVTWFPTFPDRLRAPRRVVVGAVTIVCDASIWPSAVLRADYGAISVGARTSVQDGTVLHTSAQWPTVIGAGCVVGHNAHLEGAVVEDGCLIGSMSTCLQRVWWHRQPRRCCRPAHRGTVVPPRSRVLGAPATVAPHPDPDGFAEGIERAWRRTSRTRRAICRR